MFILLLVVVFCGFTQTSAARTEPLNVFVIPVAGTVDPGLAAFIERALQRAKAGSEPLFVLEMDTFGGRVDAALQIVDALLTVPEDRSIAYVKKKAISAGALIALACGRLVMQSNTTIGDCAPITYSQEGPQALGEKFQSPLRAKFRALAKRNGYPEVLAESMVTAEMVVYVVEIDGSVRYLDGRELEELPLAEKDRIARKKTVVAAGELLTMHDSEARELGFSQMSVDSLSEMLTQLEIHDYEVVRIEPSWSESMVRFIGGIAPVLLVIGLAGLYMEMSAPGFGIPGVVGITCLAVVFLNQYLVGLADYSEMLLVALGIVLLGFEVFVIPGFGLAGYGGLLLIVAGAVLALQGFVVPDPALPWQGDLLAHNLLLGFGALILAIAAAFCFLRYVMPRLSESRQGPYLQTTLADFRADAPEAGRAKIGDIGKANTSLRPSGKMAAGDEVWDVITEGEFLAKGTRIKIVDIRGNRIIVDETSEND